MGTAVPYSHMGTNITFYCSYMNIWEQKRIWQPFPYKYVGTCQQILRLILSRYFKKSDTYVNLDTYKVFIHFLIFRVSNISYNNIQIDSSNKIAESKGHEHVTLSFVIKGSDHSLWTQQEIEGLVYQIWLFQNRSLSNYNHQEEMSSINIRIQSLLHQTLYLQEKETEYILILHQWPYRWEIIWILLQFSMLQIN